MEETKLPPADFATHLSQLAMQVLVYLGQLPHPADQSTKVDLPQAKYCLDTIEMLKEKTKGNLTSKEDEMLGQMLYDLRVRFVEASQKK